MNRSRDLNLWPLLLLPLVCAGNELVIPQLAVKFNDLPPSTAKSEVLQRPTASEAITVIGPVILSVRREDAEVPSGSSLSDPNYRAIVQSRFDKSLEPKAQGAMTAVGGHPGWSLIDAHQEAHSPSALYTYITYVIVDQHLYRLMVRAIGRRQRPPEFDAAVKAISDITFEPPSQPADSRPRSGAAVTPIRLPPYAPVGDVGMVVGLKQHGQVVVDLEFSIDGEGRAQGPKLLYAEPRQAGVLALVFLQNRIFGVPADWEESGSQSLRFTLELQFAIAPAGGSCEGPTSPPRTADTPVVQVCLQAP